jgi:TonB family protein
MISPTMRSAVVTTSIVFVLNALFVSVQTAFADLAAPVMPAATSSPAITASPGPHEGIFYLTVASMPSTAVWGPEINGLRLFLSLSRSNLQVGASVLATIDLENLGPDRAIQLGCGGPQNWYQLIIVDSNGLELPQPAAMPADCYSLGISQLTHSSVIEGTFPLDGHRISTAGSYTVNATMILRLPSTARTSADGTVTYDQHIVGTLTSNTVRLDVVPATPTAKSTPVTTIDATISYRAPLMYPQWAYERGIQGTVVVIVTIGVKGDLVTATVFKSSGYRLLDEAALSAARANTYTPYYINGNPFQTQYKIQYEFRVARPQR